MRTSIPEAVVVGVDGSSASEAALDWAAGEAVLRERPLRIVHSLIGRPDRPEGDAEAADGGTKGSLLDRSAARVRDAAPGLRVTTESSRLLAPPALIERSTTADTVVVGNHGDRPVRDLLLGSTALQVATRAQCPVVIVPSATPDQPEPDRHGIVVGVDGSPLSNFALGYAFEAAAARGAGVTLVYAWESILRDGGRADLSLNAERHRREEDTTQLKAAVKPWIDKFPNVEHTLMILRGDPVNALLAAASDASLLVVGSHGRGRLRAMILGSVSHGVIRRTNCPVAVVRPRAEDAANQPDSRDLASATR